MLQDIKWKDYGLLRLRCLLIHLYHTATIFNTTCTKTVHDFSLNHCSIYSFISHVFVAVFLHKLLVKLGDSVKHEDYFFLRG